jgi:DNA polymerase epsilon subunit 1
MQNVNDQAVRSLLCGIEQQHITRQWDIVQIRPAARGRFTMWLAVNNDVVPVTIRIPRESYLNFVAPPKQVHINFFFVN